jgi:hypothetical protein
LVKSNLTWLPGAPVHGSNLKKARPGPALVKIDDIKDRRGAWALDPEFGWKKKSGSQSLADVAVYVTAWRSFSPRPVPFHFLFLPYSLLCTMSPSTLGFFFDGERSLPFTSA